MCGGMIYVRTSIRRVEPTGMTIQSHVNVSSANTLPAAGAMTAGAGPPATRHSLAWSRLPEFVAVTDPPACTVSDSMIYDRVKSVSHPTGMITSSPGAGVLAGDQLVAVSQSVKAGQAVNVLGTPASHNGTCDAINTIATAIPRLTTHTGIEENRLPRIARALIPVPVADAFLNTYRYIREEQISGKPTNEHSKKTLPSQSIRVRNQINER